MIIIHIMNNNVVPRLLTTSVARIAETMPVAVVVGARQTGKSTLVRRLLSGDRPYFSLDDLDIRTQAERSPEELVARADRLILDEVQRVPELLIAVKRAVDENRRPGRFILTGSSNLLLMRDVSESLAGRASYLTLWPLTRDEVGGRGRAGPWSRLFDEPPDRWIDAFHDPGRAPAGDWREIVRRGGYPVPALTPGAPEDRQIWFDGYVRTYLERDLQDLSAIDNLVDFRRLMKAACLRVGQLVNQTELGRDVKLPQPTVRRWLNLLEVSYQLVTLPAYSVNRTKRLIKSPKLYWTDTGLGLHLSGASPDGAHLENHVLSDLIAWRDAHVSARPELLYWRTTIGEEVDFVIEHGGQLIGVEVKATRRPRVGDTEHLRTFRDEYGDVVRGCVLLHDGERAEILGERIVALPWWWLA